MEKARKEVGKKNDLFSVWGELKPFCNLSNQLIYEFPDRVVVVVYIKGDVANISIRGKSNVRKFTLDSINGIPGPLAADMKMQLEQR